MPWVVHLRFLPPPDGGGDIDVHRACNFADELSVALEQRGMGELSSSDHAGAIEAGLQIRVAPKASHRDVVRFVDDLRRRHFLIGEVDVSAQKSAKADA